MVVELTLLVILKDLVGLADGFEFDVGVFALVFGNFVWVRRESGLARVLVAD